MADEKPQGQGPGGGWWPSQIVRMVGVKPLPWTFAVIGIVAVLYPLVASAPAFARYEPSNPLYPVLGGMFSLSLAAVMWAVQYFTTVQSPREKKRSARLFVWFLTGSILIVGLAFVLVPGLRSTQLREIADPVLLALLMASWGGLLPLYWTSTLLEDLPSELDRRLEAIQNIENTVVQRVDQQLARLDSREKELVNHVEDATRSLLPGFTKVFQKALWMVKNAERELCMVNFAVNFGSPHLCNPKVKKAYGAEFGGKDTQLEEDVREFLKTLKAKIFALDRVQILTVSDDGCRKNFLRPLRDHRPGYDCLDVDAEYDRAVTAKAEIKRCIGESNDGSGEKILVEAESLPIQVLMVGLPSRSGSSETRFGCLVFMVGTEILNTDLEPGREPAFYTELDSMVGVFNTLAIALIRQARKHPSASRATA